MFVKLIITDQNSQRNFYYFLFTNFRADFKIFAIVKEGSITNRIKLKLVESFHVIEDRFENENYHLGGLKKFIVLTIYFKN